MLDALIFALRRISDEAQPVGLALLVLRMCAACREASQIVSPRKAAAMAFALSRKGFIDAIGSATVATWLRVLELCAGAVEVHGASVSAWAYSWHTSVSPPILQGRTRHEALELFGVFEAQLSGKTLHRFLGFMARLVGREVAGAESLTVISVLALNLNIFPQEYQDDEREGCGFQSSSVLLLSDGGFAIIKILYAPDVADFSRPKVRSSCVLPNSLADSSIWTVDGGGRLLMTLPPIGDESHMPEDLREELSKMKMFQQHRTHKEPWQRRLSCNGKAYTYDDFKQWGGPARALKLWEEARSCDAFSDSVAVQLCKARPMIGALPFHDINADAAGCQ